MHEQWLLSIESNLSRLANTVERYQKQTGEILNTLAGTMVTLAERMDTLAARMVTLAEQHRKLEETLERYIRFRGDGSQKN